MFGAGGGNVNVGVTVTGNSNAAQAALQRLGQMAANTRQQFEQLRLELIHVDRILQYMAAGAVLSLGASFLKTASDMERLRLELAVFTGSMDKAVETMGQLMRLSQSSPFSLQALTNAFVKFKAAGLDPIVGSDGRGPLKTLIDSVAAFGGDEDIFKRAVTGIQQMLGKGSISMEELRQQVGEAIPFAVQAMAQGLDMTVAELVRKVSRGMIDATTGIEAMFKVLEEKFGGFGDILASTLFGATRQIISSFQGIAAAFDQSGMQQKLTALLKMTNDFLKAFLGPEGKGAIQFFADLSERFDQFIVNNQNKIATFINTITSIGEAFGSLVDMAMGALGSLPGESLAFGLVGLLLFGRVGAAAGVVIGLVADNLAGLVEMVAGAMQGIGAALGTVGVDWKDIATYGIIGFLLLGRLGVVAGLAAWIAGQVGTIVGNVMVWFIKLIGEISAQMEALIARVKYDIENFDPLAIFNKEKRDAQKAGSQAAADKAYDESLARSGQKMKDFGRSVQAEMAAIRGSTQATGDQIKTTGHDVQTFVEKIRAVAEQIKQTQDKVRAVASDMQQGLTTGEIQALERFEKTAAGVDAKLKGLQAGSEMVTFVENAKNKVKAFDEAIASASIRWAQLVDAGKSEEAAKLRGNIDKMRDASRQFKDQLQELLKLDPSGGRNRAGVMSAVVENLNARVEQFISGGTLDNVAKKIADVQVKYTELIKAIEQAKAKRGATAIDIAQLIELEKRLTAARETAIERVKMLATLEAERRKAELLRSREDMTGTLLGIQADFFGTKEQGAILEVNMRYLNMFRQIDDQIRSIQERFAQGLIPKDTMDYEIAKWEELRVKIGETKQTAIDRARYETTAIGELWKNVGEAIDNAVGDAIEALIMKTKSLKDVMTQFYAAITRAAINYLMTEARMQIFGGGNNSTGFGLFQLMGQLFGGGFGGGGSVGVSNTWTPLSMPLGMSALGNAFAGAIKPFKNGDIIRGPTLFGLAGEAGTEAIVPLKRMSDGSLGVRMSGGGRGDNYSINIQAVDGESVRRLFLVHGRDLIDSLQRRQSLNYGMR